MYADDGGNGLAPLLHVDERRRARQIGVPEVVVDQLEVPQVLPRIGVRRHQAVAEKVVAGAVAAVLVHRGRAERHVDDAALGVHGEETPHIDARTVLPTVSGPGVVVLLTGARNGMKRPHQLACVHVPRAHVARRPMRRIFLRRAARDDEVLEHDGRRTQPVAARQPLHDLGSIQIDDAVVAKGIVGLPGLRVQRIQLAVARTEDDLRRRPRVAGPVFDTARRRGAGGELERPRFLFRWSAPRPRRGNTAWTYTWFH